MPRYTVKKDYASERSDRAITTFGPWSEGDEVEIDSAEDADWVNRDAGDQVLVEVKGKQPVAKKASTKGGSAASTEDDSGLTKGG